MEPDWLTDLRERLQRAPGRLVIVRTDDLTKALDALALRPPASITTPTVGWGDKREKSG